MWGRCFWIALYSVALYKGRRMRSDVERLPHTAEEGSVYLVQPIPFVYLKKSQEKKAFSVV